MDIRKIKKLIELMEEADLKSLEINEGEDRIALVRHFPEDSLQPIYTNVTNNDSTNVMTKAPKPSVQIIEKSPMVGVFYRSPSPNESPFITVGQTVKAGDTLAIIEAMKIMNPLEATQTGVIAEILVEDGDVVEFDQPLIRYE